MLSALLTLQLLSLSQTPATQPVAFPQHPFVMVNRQELDRLAAEIAKPGLKADLYRAPRNNAFMAVGFGVRTNADEWMTRKIEIPARGGHYHLFFCDDGDRLPLPADQRFVPGPYRCPKCGREYSGERYEGALRRVVHSWLAQAAWDTAMVWALEHKPEYAAKSAEILLKYAEAYPGPHESATKGGMIFQSLDESMWVIPLAQAYDLIYDSLTPEQCKKIETFLRVVVGGIQRCGTGGNWGSWHLSATGVVGYAIGSHELVDWATQQFKQQIRDQLGDDGLWPESVHTYHYFPLMAFADFAEAAFHAGVDLYHWEAKGKGSVPISSKPEMGTDPASKTEIGTDPGKKPQKSLMSMFTAPLAYAYPDLRLPAINDGWFNAGVPADMYELVWYREKNPQFAWVLSQVYQSDLAPAGRVSESAPFRRSGQYAFLFGEEIPSDVPTPTFASTNFPVLGICTLRAPGGAMMTFDYGPFLGHGQLDKMGITLFANNQLWAADYGTPGYGSSILSWYQSTFAHNTVVVDDKNQTRTRENKAELWLGDDGFEAVRSRTAEAYPGVTHTRTMIRIDDYFVIADDLTSDTPHTYDLYLHGEGQFTLAEADSLSNAPASAPTKPTLAGAARWLKDAQPHAAREQVHAQWRTDESALALAQFGSSEIVPITAQCPAETGSRTVPLLVSRQRGQHARFITVLVPFATTTGLEVQPLPDGIEIQRGQSRDILHLPPDGKPSLTQE